MLVHSIKPQIINNFNFGQSVKKNLTADLSRENDVNENSSTSLPIGFNTSYNITFGFTNPNRLVGDVDLDLYHTMSEGAKKRYREIYYGFATNEEVNKKDLADKTSQVIPLVDDDDINNFVEFSKIYLQYKDQPIICLGRSPKWFLNTAFWMEGGLPEYKFVAFSKYWFVEDEEEGVRKINRLAPTQEEEAAYRKYLDRIGVNPQKIVETMRETGKKTVITDFICTGKGACSFLDVMSRYAKDLGILEEFSKAIQIVGIGSLIEFDERTIASRFRSIPRVPMPPLLEQYDDNIKQTFYKMDESIFEQMLKNQNTNECRSSYYPHQAWTVYSPDRFKVGLIKDVNAIKEIKDHFKDEKHVILFTPAMQDFRNLLNFRILDYLNSKNMLRAPIRNLSNLQRLH